MWFKVLSYKSTKKGGFDRRKISKIYNYLLKNHYSNNKNLVDVWTFNLSDKEKVVDFWQKKFEQRLLKTTRGRKPIRFAYQFLINVGTDLLYEKKFKQFIKEFLDDYCSDKHAIVFIHKDSNCIHAHMLVHSVTVDNKTYRVTKEEISRIKGILLDLSKKHSLEKFITEAYKNKKKEKEETIKKSEKIGNKEDKNLNVNWGVRNIINVSRFSRKDIAIEK